MTLPAFSRAPADLALALYLEPHVEGRRVLLLGGAQGELAERLDSLAAQLEIIDPATREPSRGEVPELPFPDRSFELVVVCDVTTLPEPTEGALRELHRVLTRQGLLLAALPAQPKRQRRGAPSQALLESLLAAEFRHVRVLAQTPLAGYGVGELERRRGEEFTIEASVAREYPSEPERYLGLASDAELEEEPRLWVELPASASVQGAQASSQASLVEELRKAEDEAREALHRESDLLRELEGERRVRIELEALAERARSFERKLLAAEADYDDAVARVRYFESAIGEHEAAVGHERERRAEIERELVRQRAEHASEQSRLKALEQERDAARRDAEEAAREHDAFEARLVELGQQLLSLEQDKKQHEQTARDLLEELRRLEHDTSAAVEHDARVAELEAERERAVARALDAEVAREAAQMRTDELRAELEALSQARASAAESAPPGRRRELASKEASTRPGSASQPSDDVARTRADLVRYRGECKGLRLRLNEAELALTAAEAPGERQRHLERELAELRLELAHKDALLHAMREAPRQVAESTREVDDERVLALHDQVQRLERRIDELNRELEEADRFAEVHAEDAERLASTEADLSEARGRLEEVDDEVRALEHELRAARQSAAQARSEAEQSAIEAAVRLEVAERREVERDDARAALSEARSILSQLASRVGADENDPPSIVQALLDRDDSRTSERDQLVGELREQIAVRDDRIRELELALGHRGSLERGTEHGEPAND